MSEPKPVLTDGVPTFIPIFVNFVIAGAYGFPQSTLTRAFTLMSRSVVICTMSISSKVWPLNVAGLPTTSDNSWLRVKLLDAASATEIMITPTCTIMPPLARPTRPRQPWRRVASTTWRSAEPVAKPPKPNASKGAKPVAPTNTLNASAPMPHHAGQNNRCDNNSSEALRHGSTGAIAIKVSIAMPMGIVN